MMRTVNLIKVLCFGFAVFGSTSLIFAEDEPTLFNETDSELDDVETCGGLIGKVCPDKMVCVFGDGQCMFADYFGECQEKPEVCTDHHDPVCGCDRKTYSNRCEATSAGMSVMHVGACGESASRGLVSSSGTELSLGVGEVGTVGAIAIMLVSVNDSRCPEGAKCPLLGNAEITFRISPEPGVSTTIIVNTNNRFPTSGEILGVKIELRGLSPERPKPDVVPVYTASILVET